MNDARVVVTFSASPGMRDAIDAALNRLATVVYLPDVPDDERRATLLSADAVLAWFIRGELRGPEELDLLSTAGLLQLLSAGVDRVPVDLISETLPIAANAGAYAEPMAEHVIAMTLMFAKRLRENHAAMARGEFDQETPTRAIRGATVGVLGFGGIGQASARLFTALGARIHAINRSGRTDVPVDWIGTLADLDSVLAAADVVVVALPLLVNVARAAIIDDDALYEHLRANPSFSAGIDTWWREPHSGGEFVTRRPFLELPNVIGSPHNSALTAGTLEAAARRAAENIARHLRDEPVEHLVDRSEYAG